MAELTPEIKNVIKEAVDGMGITSNNPIPQVMQKLSANPDKMSGLIEKVLPHTTPDMMAKAKKMVQSGQGQQLVRQMQRRGYDPHRLRQKAKSHMNTLESSVQKKEPIPCRKAIFITINKKIKSKDIPINNINGTINSLIKTETPSKLPISVLATGAWQGLNLICYCNPNDGGRNDIMSKLLDSNIMGDVLILCTAKDLMVEDFNQIAGYVN